MIDLNNKHFRATANSGAGEVDTRTRFTYYQDGEVVWGTYAGGSIRFGTLTGVMEDSGQLRFAYQHVNDNLRIMTGFCRSTPEILADGRIRMHETWEWTSGGEDAGQSVIEEIPQNTTS
ncbi:MAG: hypothetical protein R3301_08865 [Saprospiraceae bacterium]|nr:hypothetical protein [Saprospiraceae bacterium]